jgi:hypothetical protein
MHYYRLKRAWSKARAELAGRTTPGRGAAIYDDDVLIVSYPKSGNTWTRFLIGNLISQDEPLTFANVERKVPSIYLSEEVLQRAPKPRLLKSHEYFDPRYKKVIYIVRDPRDVAVSYYHFFAKVRLIEDGYPMDEFVLRFIAGELDGFGSWGENVGSWLGARGEDPKFLLLRYEDMLENPVHELRKVTSLLSMSATDERLDRAVELSSADRMRRLEKEQSWEGIKENRRDKAFVRVARAGNWRNELSEASAAQIEEAWGQTMERLGYRLQAIG